MITKLIEKLKAGQFTYRQLPGDWNRMINTMLQGAHVYDFGGGIQLRSYTKKSWLLYVDNDLVSGGVKGEDDALITQALEASIQFRLKGA